MKKRKLGKQALSLLLALVLSLTALPLQALAEEAGLAPESSEDGTSFYSLDPIEVGKAAVLVPRAAYGSISTSDVISIADSLAGYPYVEGGRSPSDGGFDCSGLVYYVYHTRLGADVTYQQIYDRSAGVKIENRDDFQTGDIVFGLNQYGGWHTGIFVSGNTMIHAGSSGGVCRTTMSGWFTVKFARRLPEVMQGPAQHTHTKGEYKGYLGEHPHHSCFSCVECGETFSDDSTSNFNPHCSICHPSHTWDGGHVTDEPTFTQSGSRQYTCTICGYQRNEFIPMLDSVTAQYSDSIRMTYHRDGLLEIYGTGEVIAPQQGDGCIQFSLPGFEMKDYLDQVTRVQISEGITVLKGSVFGRMDNLEAIGLPDSLTYLEHDNFYLADGYPKLRSIHIPAGVSMIDGWGIGGGKDDHFTGCPFGSCRGLINFSVDAANPFFSAQDGVLFDRSKETLLYCPAGKTGSYTIPNSVTKIGHCAFSVSKLTHILIPDSVTEIGSDAFSSCYNLTSINIPDSVTEIYSGAFASCYSLTSIVIPSSITEIRMDLFRYSGLTSIDIPDSVTEIGSHAFYGCKNLTSVSIPGSVAEIYSSAFEDCAGLTGVSLPDGITSLHDETFSGCSNLTSISIPGSVTSIGEYAFRRCDALRDVYYGGTAAQWKAIAISGGNEPLESAAVHCAAPIPPSGNTMGPNNELTWARNGRTVTVTGPVSAAQPLFAASYDKAGRLLGLTAVTSSGGSASLPAGMASCKLIWLDGNRAPRCASALLK